MSTNILFDTHAYIDRLERSGVVTEHAVAISKANQEMLAEAFSSGVASKSDVVDIQQSIKDLDLKIDKVQISLDKKIDLVEVNLNRRLDSFDAKLDKVSLQITIRIGSMIVISVGVVSAIFKLF